MSALPRPEVSREALIHQLYEAAELEHNLMCTYLYAAFSLKSGADEGLIYRAKPKPPRAGAARFSAWPSRRWDISPPCGTSPRRSAARPRFGRMNFPLDPGGLPANVVVRLAPFSEAVLQHFIYLERPDEVGRAGWRWFHSGFPFHARRHAPARHAHAHRLRHRGPVLRNLVRQPECFRGARGRERSLLRRPQSAALAQGNRLPGLRSRVLFQDRARGLRGHRDAGRRRRGGKSGLALLPLSAPFARNCAQLKAANPAFEPAHPAAVNPVLRRPVRAGVRVWLEDEQAAATVDIANTAYMLMLRLIAHSYLIPRPHPAKALCVDLGLGLMRAMAPLAEQRRAPARRTHPIRAAMQACRSPRCAMPRHYLHGSPCCAWRHWWCRPSPIRSDSLRPSRTTST